MTENNEPTPEKDSVSTDISAFDDEWTPIQQMAIALNEMYNAFRLSGFNDDQAIRLTAFMSRTGEDYDD